MRAWTLGPTFGLDHLALTEAPDGTPGPGQIRLRMRAVSLNFRDLLMVRGHYNPRQPLPLVPCSDGVGLVDAVGEGVTRVKVGDRVCPIFAQKWLAGRPTKGAITSTLGGPLDGTLRTSMVLSEEGVVHVPAHLTDAQAATLPCAALTAWSAMVVEGDVTAGTRVLLQGTGGVSIAALQLAVALGAEVIVTSSSDAKLEKARALGAHHTINYTTHPNWSDEVLRITGRLGVDHVVEVGGAGTIEQSIRAVAPGGHISLIGILSGATQPLQLTRVLMNHIRIQGILVGHRDGFEQMNRAIAAHRIEPVVDTVFAFEDAPKAFDLLASARHVGKVCIEVGG
jgi:NADPH:quinone reductase-like Zn-dependent oxidoreductase